MNNQTPLTKEQNAETLLQDNDRFQNDYTVFTFKFNGVPIKFVALTDADQAIKQERSRVVEMIEPKYNEAIQALHTEFPPKFMAGGGEVGRIVPQREQRLQLEIAIYGNLLEALKEL